MGKWFYLILTILFYIPILDIALDGRGDFFLGLVFSFPFLLLSIVFAILTLISWGRNRVSKDKKTNLFFILIIPSLIMLIFGILKYYELKSERPYFLFAKDPLSSHDYMYYFRDDSLMKIHGSFKMDDADFYQTFKLKGDTILLDTILPISNLVSKKYVKTSLKNISGKDEAVLVPLNKKGDRMDTFILKIVEDKKFYY